MTTSQNESRAEKWHVALFEVRHDGKHSQAEDTSQFIAHGTGAELDALEAEIRDRGNWVTWNPEALNSPSDVREHYAWLMAPGQESEALVEPPSLEDVPASSQGRHRGLIEDRLRTNSSYTERIEKRRAAGKLAPDQAEALQRYWREERVRLEAELAELDATTSG